MAVPPWYTVTSAPATGASVPSTTSPRTTPPDTETSVVALGTPATEAVTVAVPEAMAVSVTLPLVSPAGIVTEAGARTTPTFDDVKATSTPPASAGEASVRARSADSPASSAADAGRTMPVWGTTVTVRVAGTDWLLRASKAVTVSSIVPVADAGTARLKSASAGDAAGENVRVSLAMTAPDAVSSMRATPRLSVPRTDTDSVWPAPTDAPAPGATMVTAGGTSSSGSVSETVRTSVAVSLRVPARSMAAACTVSVCPAEAVAGTSTLNRSV